MKKKSPHPALSQRERVSELRCRPMEPGELDALLSLTLVSGLAPLPTRRALDALGSAPAVLGSNAARLASAAQINRPQAEKICAGIEALADGKKLAREKELIEQLGVTLLPLGDPAYPRLLTHIPDPPPLLFVRGQIREDDALALAIVGSRRCSGYG